MPPFGRFHILLDREDDNYDEAAKQVALRPGTVLNGIVQAQYNTAETITSVKVTLRGTIKARLRSTSHKEEIELFSTCHEIISDPNGINVAPYERRPFRFEFYVPQKAVSFDSETLDDRFADSEHSLPPAFCSHKQNEDFSIVYSLHAEITRAMSGMAAVNQRDLVELDNLPCHPRISHDDEAEKTCGRSPLRPMTSSRKSSLVSLVSLRKGSSTPPSSHLPIEIAISFLKDVQPGKHHSCLVQFLPLDPSAASLLRTLRIERLSSSWAIHETLNTRFTALPALINRRRSNSAPEATIVAQGKFTMHTGRSHHVPHDKLQQEELCFWVPHKAQPSFKSWSIAVSHRISMLVHFKDSSTNDFYHAIFELPIRISHRCPAPTSEADFQMLPNMREMELPSYDMLSLAAPAYETVPPV